MFWSLQADAEYQAATFTSASLSASCDGAETRMDDQNISWQGASRLMRNSGIADRHCPLCNIDSIEASLLSGSYGVEQIL